MENTALISAIDFCKSQEITVSFIEVLSEYELLETTTVEHVIFFPERQLPEAERFVRLHRDLQINPEGLQAVAQLLNKIDRLQLELTHLQNELRFHGEIH